MQNSDDETCKSELDYFNLFLDDELLMRIIAELNKYASQKSLSYLKKFIWKCCKEIITHEIRFFFGLVLNIVFNKKPEISDYFRNRPLFY